MRERKKWGKGCSLVAELAHDAKGKRWRIVRGTVPGMVPGTILGHEGVGIVEEVGKEVRFQDDKLLVVLAHVCP